MLIVLLLTRVMDKTIKIALLKRLSKYYMKATFFVRSRRLFIEWFLNGTINLLQRLNERWEDFTEYTSLTYLEKHAPDVPVPRPHGVLEMSDFFVIFMTYSPSMTLEHIR